MNASCVLSCIAIACCLSCHGQTNVSSAAAVSFFLPPVQLRLEPSSVAEKVEPLISLKPTGLAQVNVSAVDPSPMPATAAEIVFGDDNFRGRVVRSGEFYLTRPEREPDDPIARFVDRTFNPEVVHIGKIPVTCSIWTAIKRKNPLCLLNPIFFQASW